MTSKKKKILFGSILFFLTLLVLEGASRLTFAYILPDGYARIRAVLAGETGPEALAQDRITPNTIGQAYLLYIPAPGYTKNGKLVHNSQGYRGRAVNMDREEGVYRILFLGGSTTYSVSVEDSDQTFPAQVERLLNDPASGTKRRVEVINAGLPAGSSAEMFTHYHFKFHYYKPDLVVIHTGGNDAQTKRIPYYHPDYSHHRQQPVTPKELPWPGRVVLKSRLLGLLVMPIIYGFESPDVLTTVNYSPKAPPPARWYPRMTLPDQEFNIIWDEYGFVHNIGSLISEISSDGARVVLLPFREAPMNRFNSTERKLLELNRHILRTLGTKLDVAFVPFPQDIITPENWIDKCCHLNEAGVLEKARYFAPHIRKIILEDAQGASG